MNKRHYPFWPKRFPYTLEYPDVPVFRILEVAGEFYPNKTAVNYYGNSISYGSLLKEINYFAGALFEKGIRKGDRVAIFMQNTPQYIISFFAILRANAVAVPINPMNNEKELAFILKNCGAAGIITTTDLASIALSAGKHTELGFVVAGSYKEYISEQPNLLLPEIVTQSVPQVEGCIPWSRMMETKKGPPECQVGSDDICILPYTSGSTGKPKGCVHTNRTVVSNIVGGSLWSSTCVSSVHLSVLPMFHVTGLVDCLLAPLSVGATIVLLTRWDRKTALDAIEQFRVTHFINIATMIVDLLGSPDLSQRDVSSLLMIGGGGAPLPEAVGRKLQEITGLQYVEGYGLTESIAQTHFNPPDRPKMQCMGIPYFGVDARIIDFQNLKELSTNTPGEMILKSPSVFLEYWNAPDDTKDSFVEYEGNRYFRTGDICYTDEDGYFFLVDRTKRMINAAGFKVWPAEVENTLYSHPAVKEACVVGIPDPVRIEQVRAYIVLKDDAVGKFTGDDIINWSKQQMAAYKYPRQVVFVDEIPKSGTGKNLWRLVQEKARSEMNQ